MKVLVTNDDGINSPNLKMLVKELTNYFREILVIAPACEQSAVSHKINIKGPLILQEIEPIIDNIKTYTLDSTPADCVKIASNYLKYDFDIVFSGVNNGLNLGEDILYSGTVAAIKESALKEKKGIALSITRDCNIGFVDGFKIFMNEFFTNNIYNEYNCFNVNFPNEIKGIKYTYQGTNKYDYWFELNESNKLIPKAKVQYIAKKDEFTTDIDAIQNNYISITPITVDQTNYEILKKVINN